MGYRLRDEVSFCTLDGRFVFLDVGRDRYFCLSARLDTAFSRLLRGDALADGDRTDLLSLGLVEPAQGAGLIRPALTVEPASSLADQATSLESAGVCLPLVVTGALAGARLRLKRAPLSQSLEHLRAARSRIETCGSQEASQAVAAGFNAARRLAPFKPSCLPDALALLAILARARCDAALVFGVRLAPFGAHCWVQSGAVVLNDPLDRVRAHTPILVV